MLDVERGQMQEVGVVLELAEPAIAVEAEQCPNRPGRMVVIDVHRRRNQLTQRNLIDRLPVPGEVDRRVEVGPAVLGRAKRVGGVEPAARGLTELGWLHSRHTFSFGEYYDPDHMGFRSLRVINDDIVEPGQGFGTHSHRDAEIFSYVIEGELQHKDSLGNGSIIKPGNLQYMSAGSGVRHSEFNPSPDKRVQGLAERIVAASQAQEGVGAFLLDGKMIDAPFVRRARDVLLAAGRAA